MARRLGSTMTANVDSIKANAFTRTMPSVSVCQADIDTTARGLAQLIIPCEPCRILARSYFENARGGAETLERERNHIGARARKLRLLRESMSRDEARCRDGIARHLDEPHGTCAHVAPD